MKKASIAIVYLLGLVTVALGGELERFMNWQDRRDVLIGKEIRTQRFNDVLDSIWDTKLQANNAAVQAAMKQAKENPNFETELAAIRSGCLPNMNLPGARDLYFVLLRELHERWGVEFDEEAERKALEDTGYGGADGGAQMMTGAPGGLPSMRGGSGMRGGPPPKPPKPTTKEVIDAAESGLSLGSSIASAITANDAANGGTMGSVLTPMPRDNGTFIVPQAPVIRPGQRHPVAAHVVRSTLMEWEPEPGYDWNIPVERRAQMPDWVSVGVHWVPGIEHSEHPHVIAGENEGEWIPAPGWRFASHRDDDWSVVRK